MNLSTETQLPTGVVEDVPLPKVAVEGGGLSEAVGVMLRNEPSSLGSVGVPSQSKR